MREYTHTFRSLRTVVFLGMGASTVVRFSGILSDRNSVAASRTTCQSNNISGQGMIPQVLEMGNMAWIEKAYTTPRMSCNSISQSYTTPPIHRLKDSTREEGEKARKSTQKSNESLTACVLVSIVSEKDCGTLSMLRSTQPSTV